MIQDSDIEVIERVEEDIYSPISYPKDLPKGFTMYEDYVQIVRSLTCAEWIERAPISAYNWLSEFIGHAKEGYLIGEYTHAIKFKDGFFNICFHVDREHSLISYDVALTDRGMRDSLYKKDMYKSQDVAFETPKYNMSVFYTGTIKQTIGIIRRFLQRHVHQIFFQPYTKES